MEGLMNTKLRQAIRIQTLKKNVPTHTQKQEELQEELKVFKPD